MNLVLTLPVPNDVTLRLSSLCSVGARHSGVSQESGQRVLVRREDLGTRTLPSPWEFLETLWKPEKESNRPTRKDREIVSQGPDVRTKGKDLCEMRNLLVRLSKGSERRNEGRINVSGLNSVKN